MKKWEYWKLDFGELNWVVADVQTGELEFHPHSNTVREFEDVNELLMTYPGAKLCREMM